MMAADAIREPFAVINADDFYGAEAYKTIGDYLSQLGESRNRYCMVAYDLDKTLYSALRFSLLRASHVLKYSLE